jgi:hypothetical protein
MAAKKSRAGAAASQKDKLLSQLQGARQVTEEKHERPRAACHVPHIYVIRIRDQKNRERAIVAFLRVRAGRVTLPGNIMGVSEEHIEALEKEGIPFEYLSKSAHDQ